MAVPSPAPEPLLAIIPLPEYKFWFEVNYHPFLALEMASSTYLSVLWELKSKQHRYPKHFSNFVQLIMARVLEI